MTDAIYEAFYFVEELDKFWKISVQLDWTVWGTLERETVTYWIQNGKRWNLKCVISWQLDQIKLARTKISLKNEFNNIARLVLCFYFAL